MKKTGKYCLYCQKALFGRSDKKYCDVHCKSAFEYEERKQDSPLYYRIDGQLKKNRRILKRFNRHGRTILEKNVLVKEGFDPSFFTHYYKSSSGQIFLFCHEYGFLKIEEKGNIKYVLVHWQSYMNSADLSLNA